MKTYMNNFGESVTGWESHVHPDNKDYMQIVRYLHIAEKGLLCWTLGGGGRWHHIYNINLAEAIAKYPEIIT